MSGQKMYTGAYTVASTPDDADGIVYKAYYDEIKKFSNYSEFPASVWSNEDRATPTYTVYGEFSSNKFSVESGALKQSFGSLTMYYHEKDTEDRVYATYLGGDRKGETVAREYKYNSATSQFFISLSSTESSSSKYCTFAQLNGDDSWDELEDLMDDIEDYIEDVYGEEEEKSFVTSHSVRVDEDDPFVGKKPKSVTFEVPNKPIIIKKVSVKKY
jgi:cyclophilin family peptidyl-prolyl cis-trans isomerase